VRANGESFAMPLVTLNGPRIEADGRAIGGRAGCGCATSSAPSAIWPSSTPPRQNPERHESLRALIEALPSPVWTRDIAGTLTYVNTAYVRAVEAAIRPMR